MKLQCRRFVKRLGVGAHASSSPGSAGGATCWTVASCSVTSCFLDPRSGQEFVKGNESALLSKAATALPVPVPSYSPRLPHASMGTAILESGLQ